MSGTSAWRDNKIILYLVLTALMVVTFASAMLILNTLYGAIGWGLLLATNLAVLVVVMLK
ncbi:MAG: hypothetical protein AMJ68_11250 [Acidithiobacillales bacterium SG8_45]|jgi:hypothetical protein|nr:MAG: hypothetical protein AMJ68_11250 [Acidithiobacillales bacterium SG8_45]